MSALPPDHCPLCGQPNQCAMEIARLGGTPPGACWCTQVSFDAQLLATVPLQAQGKACICRACATRAQPVPAAS